MAVDRPLEETSGEDIYDAATGIEPEAAEAPAEASEAPAEAAPVEETAPERTRDERGRFAKAEQPVVETPEPAKQSEPEHRIPLAELLNEREKRQNEQRRAEQLMRELEHLRQQLQPPRQQQAVPDQFADPEGYNAYWEQRFQMQQQNFQSAIRAVQAENSLARAHQQYGKVFEEGYQAVLDRAQQGDRTVAQLIANAPNPGDAIVNWYKREQTLQKVGTDPDAYVQKVLEEALENPEFLAKALEKAKGVAAAQPSQQIKLPPSLNKATAAARSDDGATLSDAGIYSHAIGR